MLDYQYYQNIYKGKVDEVEFDRLLIQANLIVENYTLKPDRLAELRDDDNVKLALCEIIDNLKEHDKVDLSKYLAGVSSESVKDHSKTFAKDSPLERVERSKRYKNIEIMQRYLTSTGLLYRGL